MEEVLEMLNKQNVRYLLIGGQAMRLQGMPRFSMDWDLFVPGKDIERHPAVSPGSSRHLVF